MRVLPAIDLKDGRCVRLMQGRADAVTVYADDPAEPAREFVAAGATWIHVVDLDGAFGGVPKNADAVRAIAAAGARIQLGGGLRDLEAVGAAVEVAERVVLGTVAVRDPALLEEACRRFPGRILVGLDERDGEVAVEGWVVRGGKAARVLAQQAKAFGAAGIVYTDIARDGMRSGVNVEATAGLAKACGLPVVASGGVKSLEDLAALARHPGITAAITGRAVYEGDLDLAEACRRFDDSELYG